MAYDWNAGLRGAGQGAATGLVASSWLPVPGARLIGTAVGAGLGLLSGFGGGDKVEEVSPTLLNPEQYQEGLDTASGTYNDYNALMQGMMAQSSGYGRQGSSLLQQYLMQPDAQYRYDPMEAQREFLRSAPQLQALARDSVGDGDLTEYLREERSNIANQVGDTFGGNRKSGAYMASASQALATPMIERANYLSGLRAQLMGQLMGNSQQMLNQNYLQQAQGDYNQQMDNRNRYLSGVTGYQGLADNAMQGANVYGSMAQTGLSGLLNMSQPIYSTPDYKVTPGALSGLSQGLGDAATILSLGSDLQDMRPKTTG